jgi:ribosomal protein L30E
MKSKVPLVRVDKSSAEIGRILGRPFRVSAVALRVVSEGDLRALVGTTVGKPE